MKIPQKKMENLKMYHFRLLFFLLFENIGYII